MSDLAAMREAMADPRAGRSVALGLVVADDDSGSHYEATDTDILVRVELQPEQRKLWCRLAGMAAGRGVSMIPAVGDEVVIVIPGGEIHADPILVAILATGSVSGNMAERTVVITGNDVKITALAGGSVTVNGGTTRIPKLGDQVTVTVPQLTVNNAVALIPGPVFTTSTTATGTITSATAGDSRLKG